MARRRLCLVTGASAGIGAAFARTFAAQGWDVALTARRAERLEALARELAERFQVEAFAVPGDLAESATPERLVSEIAARGRMVDGFVDNAGYGLRGEAAGRWADQSAFLQVMVAAPTELSHRLLPGMMERGYGRVVHVASLMGLLPALPGHGLYSAAKAYLVKLAEAQHLQGRGAGVHVSVVCPGLTRSEFHDVAELREAAERAPGWMWMQADQVAEAAYAAVEANRPLCVPGAPNKAVAALARALPERWALRLAARTGEP